MAGGTEIAQQLLNGLTIGMVYVLLAAGLSIIFGVMDVINFAHGEFFALGAYFALAIAGPATGGFWVALVVAPLLVALVGGVIERLTIRPLYDRDPLYHILLTFGLVLVINDLITMQWGKQPRYFPKPDLLNQTVELFGFSYSLYSYFMILFGVALALGTWLLLNRTRFGMIVRAGSQDREMVRNLGIDIDRYYTLVFGFGAALAAIGGVVIGPYQSVGPSMGSDIIIPAFVIVVLGGLGSFRGAVLGGLLVGVMQTMTRSYVPELEGLAVFILMIGVLLVKPRGLFGNPEWHSPHGEEGELLAGGHGGLLEPALRSRLGMAVVGLLALVPLAASVLDQPYWLTLLNEVLVWALFALSLDFVMGYAGLVSLGHTLFYGVGAYAAVLALIYVSPSVFVVLPLAILVCAALAWVVGHLSIRVSGVYFAMITLGFAELFYNAVFKLDVVGGSDGLFGLKTLYGVGGVGVYLNGVRVALGPVTVTGKMVFYYFLLGVVVLAYLTARRFMRAPFGSVLQGIRESEERARFVGYDVTAYKRRAFVVSGGMAGLAGGLFVANPSNGYVDPSFLHWLNSGEVIVMTVLGGMGTLYGPMLGAGVFIGFKDFLSTYIAQWQLVLGLVFIGFVIFVPRGLVSLPQVLVQASATPFDEGDVGPEDADVAREDREVNVDD